MLDFAVKRHGTPDECEETDVARLRQFGYADKEILHIAELTAIFTYNGRLPSAMGSGPWLSKSHGFGPSAVR